MLSLYTESNLALKTALGDTYYYLHITEEERNTKLTKLLMISKCAKDIKTTILMCQYAGKMKNQHLGLTTNNNS